MLSPSQAKNYFSKLRPYYNNEGCGCCYSTTEYEIKGRRILQISYGENMGRYYHRITVIAKLRKVGSN